MKRNWTLITINKNNETKRYQNIMIMKNNVSKRKEKTNNENGSKEKERNNRKRKYKTMILYFERVMT